MTNEPKSSIESTNKIETEGIIFFVDLVGSSAVSSERGIVSFYEDYIRHFYGAIERAILYAKSDGIDLHYIQKITNPERNQNEVFGSLRYRGDELVGFLLFKKNDENGRIQKALVQVVRFLYSLKLFWLASGYNLSRVTAGQRPRDISSGIHVGPVYLVPDGTSAEFFEIGYAINLAKRIEGASRSGQSSRIFATSEAAQLFTTWKKSNFEDTSLITSVQFTKPRQGDPEYFRGIDPPPDVCELDICLEGAPRVFKWLEKFENGVHLRNGIAKPLRTESTVSWLCESDTVDANALNCLEKNFPSYSNLWLQINVNLLLLAFAKEGNEYGRHVGSLSDVVLQR